MCRQLKGGGMEIKMKIYGTKPEENEAAEMVFALYINLALEQINESNEWLKKAKEPYQVMLINIDILLMIANKFPVNANLLIKKYQIKEWKETFDEWFIRCGNKIPSKYRKGIKDNADELFERLENFGHNLRY